MKKNVPLPKKWILYQFKKLNKYIFNNHSMVIGYTTGVYDLFHIGHLNLLKNAKGLCDKLIVGVTVDELVSYKGKQAMIPFEERIEIVRSIKYVDTAVPQYDMDKLTACKKLGASILFVGDDWYGTEKWKEYEKQFEKAGIKIIYFPYTKGISSTKITQILNDVRH
ncbi:MAG: adenylyltransferase/cytidyltransferase family protein [Prevotella sp.]|nr:adenylyltransferase/cytidyltransferase family protein [Prevotella sp.]